MQVENVPEAKLVFIHEYSMRVHFMNKMESSDRAAECECYLHSCNMVLNLPGASSSFATEAVF